MEEAWSGAPTLIKIDDNQSNIPVKLFVLDMEYSNNKQKAISILMKREGTTSERFIHETSLNDYPVVLYANFDKKGKNTPDELAKSAIESVNNCKKKEYPEKNGIRYLLNNIKSGVITPLTKDYKTEILSKTKRNTLEEAESYCLNLCN